MVIQKRLKLILVLLLFFFILTANIITGEGMNERNDMESSSTSGIISKSTFNKGTLSEYSVFHIITAESMFVLFNSKGRSSGFDAWIGKRVVLEYVFTTGIVGVTGKKKYGYRVVSIDGNLFLDR